MKMKYEEPELEKILFSTAVLTDDPSGGEGTGTNITTPSDGTIPGWGDEPGEL